VVLYGNGQVAELALARLRERDEFEVVGFTVDRPFVGDGTLHGLPVVPFDTVAGQWPPAAPRRCVAIGPAQVNRLRAPRGADARSMGYRLINVVSPSAKVAAGVVMGENCTIGDGCIVLPYSTLGDDVHVGTACVVGHHARIGDHAFLAIGVTLAGSVTIGPCAVLGAGVIVRDRVTVGEAAYLGAGVVMAANAPPHAVYAAPEPVRLPIASDRLPGMR
jgi:sugar O-acyltransferase (sialic acid O-acetyltransferase NeuD family)